MSDEFRDLFGDPIPPGFQGRGRPPHQVTEEKRLRVIGLAALNKSEADIAGALGITKPTLKKHYFRELKYRQEARMRVEALLIGTLIKETAAGNVTAARELDRKMQRADLDARPSAPAPKSDKPVGKKQRAAEEADSAHLGTDWQDLLGDDEDVRH